ncbi:MAG: hypothetical protein RIC85_03040 [Gammaproteobacteria bacterium]
MKKPRYQLSAPTPDAAQRYGASPSAGRDSAPAEERQALPRKVLLGGLPEDPVWHAGR